MKNSSVYAPPGMETEKEKNYFLLLLIVAAVASCNFFTRLIQALERLESTMVFYRYDQMPDFYRLLDGNFLGFGVVALYCIGTVAFRFWYYYQGSKSIYLMRRLPDRSVLVRSGVEMPLKRILLSLAVMAGMVVLFYMVYWIATPEQYLQPDQWQKLWRWIL